MLLSGSVWAGDTYCLGDFCGSSPDGVCSEYHGSQDWGFNSSFSITTSTNTGRLLCSINRVDCCSWVKVAFDIYQCTEDQFFNEDTKSCEECPFPDQVYNDYLQICIMPDDILKNPDDCDGVFDCEDCHNNGGNYYSPIGGGGQCIPDPDPDPDPDPEPDPEPDPDPDPEPDPEPDPDLEAQNITNNITNNNTTNNTTINNYGSEGEGEGEGEEETYSDYQTPDSQIDEAVPEMGQSFSDFYDSIESSPLIESFKDIGDSIPTGGSCPTYDFNIAYFNRTYRIEAHCILFPDIAWILSVCMMGAWSLGAVFVFLKA